MSLSGESILNSFDYRAFLITSSNRAREAVVYTLWTISGLFIVNLIRGFSFQSMLGIGLRLIPAWIFTTLAVYILNDLYDRHFDRIIDRDQPLVTGKVTPKQAMIVVISFTGISLMISLSMNVSVFIFSVAYLVLGMLYSIPIIHIKGMFLGKQFTLAALFTISMGAGAASVQSFPPQIIFILLSAGVFIFFMSPILDLKDMDSDKEQKCKTMPLLIGPDKSVNMGIFALTLLLISSFVGYLYFNFNIGLVLFIALLCAINLRKMIELRTGEHNREDYVNVRNRSIYFTGIMLPIIFTLAVI